MVITDEERVLRHDMIRYDKSLTWTEKAVSGNNNNNTLIYLAPAFRMTSEALADSSSRATECLTEK